MKGLAITIRPDQAEQGAASRVVPQPGAAPFPAIGRASGRGPVGQGWAVRARVGKVKNNMQASSDGSVQPHK